MIIDGKLLAKILTPGQTINLGMKKDSNQLVVCSSDLTDLSASNPGYACVYSNTAGKSVVLTFTANATINDSGHDSPQILGRLGTAASIAWGNDMPNYIGVINKDDISANARFCIGRNPLPSFDSGASTNIGKSGTAAGTSAQTNIIIMDSGVTVADYANKVVTNLGSFKITINDSLGGSALVTALIAGQDGFGLWNEQTSFVMPVGQNGATAGSFLYVAGGDLSNDVPTWATPASIIFTYQVGRNGKVNINFNTQSAGNCTNGDVAAQLFLVIPLAGITTSYKLGGYYYASGATPIEDKIFLKITNTTLVNLGLPIISILANQFSSAGNSLSAEFDYQAF